MKPRYTVGTVTGWPITPTSMLGFRFTTVKPSTLAYVYDSACCYREIAHFNSRGGHIAEAKAQALADKMNADEERGQTDLTEYMGCLLYVGKPFIFVYDADRNLLATTTSKLAAKATIHRRQARARAI